MSFHKSRFAPRSQRFLALALILLAGSLPAECAGWTTCPLVSELAASDDGNSPVLTDPGHTEETPICPPSVNANKRLQLDITDSFARYSGTTLELLTYYNTNSAASTTRQFWFLDTDLNKFTGGHDGVRPEYVRTGPAAGQGEAACSSAGCTTPFLNVEHTTGWEYYVTSTGQGATELALFWWNGLDWIEIPLPPSAVNHQGAENNPINPYPSANGYRSVTGIPKSLVGITDQAIGLYMRSWSCTECCGDDTGGEGVILQPGMRPCGLSMCGDCDGDGRTTILDAFRAASYDAGMAPLTDQQMSNCNVFGIKDPSYAAHVTVLDALEIARYIAGTRLLDCCALP